MFRILHLSDLHFGSQHGLKRNKTNFDLGQAVADAVSGFLKGKSLDLLVLSGDIFSKNQKADFAPAKKGLQSLFSELKISRDKVLIIPGNHDAEWDASGDKFASFKRLIDELKVRGRKPVAAIDEPKLYVLPGKPGQRGIAVLLLNSSIIEGRTHAGIGEIGDKARRHIHGQLQKEGITDQSHHIIAVLHHHLLPVRELLIKDEEKASGSLTADASIVMNALANWGVSVALHGHQHQPAIVAYKNLLAKASCPLFICSAGSCGAADSQRHFFLYEVDDIGMDIRSFHQSPENERLFFQDGANDRRVDFVPVSFLRPPAPPVVTLPTACSHDLEMTHAARNWKQIGKNDSSDLFYLFLTVKQCDQSRKLIRQLATKPRMWGNAKPAYFQLAGMYDLAGRWDLAVRFRAAERDVKSYEDAITKYLQKNHQWGGGLRFSEKKSVNVRREGLTIPLLETASRHSAHDLSISRVRLPTSSDYARRRCQRAFLYIDLPPASSNQARESFLSALARDIAAQETEWKASGAGSIIEGYCLGDDALIIETFLRCSQSWHMNQLNRAVEKTVGEYGIQKYTLTCYEYDEKDGGIGTRPKTQ